MTELPHHIDAEATILGHLLTENQVLFHVPFLKAGHFFEPVHQRIFSAIERHVAGGDRANVLTLRDHFARDEGLAGIGGAKYLLRLTGAAVGDFAPVECARLLVSLSHKRQLLMICRQTLLEAEEDPAVGYEEMVAGLHSSIEAISAESASRRVRDDFEVTEAIIERLKTRRDPFSTGLWKLDDAMGGGLFPGRSYGFAARKKIGKTVLASTISGNLNAAGVKHLFIAGEMGSEEIHERNLARSLGAKPSAFRGSDRDSPDFLGRVSAASRASNRCILYQDAPGLTFDDLRRYIAGAIYRDKIKGVILDYWQLVGGKPKNKSTSEHLDEVAQWIADFCRKHGIWSITMAQINQEGNTRGGEGIRLAFDQVYQIHREDVSQPQAWLEMLDTRYTAWKNIGSAAIPGLLMHEHGPFFEQIDLR